MQLKLAVLLHNNILSDFQFGFGTDLSTINAANVVGNYLIVFAFVDLSKAFDSVDHELVLNKFRKVGFGPKAVKWFRHYFVD